MITYRKADSSDREVLVRLRLEFLKEAQNIEADERTQMIAANLSSYFSDTMRDGSFVSWLAFDGDEVVGTSGMCFYMLPPSYKNPGGRVAYIMNMYTRPSHRKRGIAGILFGRLLDEARALGYHKISLHATEMGRPVYEKFGFKATKGEMVLMM